MTYADILTSLRESRSTISESALSRAVAMLQSGQSVVVSGTLLSGRVELSRGLAGLAGRNVVSTIYAAASASPHPATAAVIEALPVRDGYGLEDVIVPGSQWTEVGAAWPSIGGALLLSAGEWIFMSPRWG